MQQLRRLFLTGWVIALFPEETVPNQRLSAAIVVTLTMIVLALYFDPYKDANDSRLYSAVQVMLLVVFQAGVIIRLCKDEALCQTFGFARAYDVSIACGLWSCLTFAVVAVMISIKAFMRTNDAHLRLRNGKLPTVTLAAEHMYHTFVSHIWESGQDQAAVIKRQLLLLMPTAKVFLDVDDLVEIGALEKYVRGTACMLLFLSRGYFRSRNCMREVRAAVAENKPWVLVHEADAGKGGLPLEASKAECPDELRQIIFTHCEYFHDRGSFRVKPLDKEARARQVVTWMRIKDFQLLSLRLVCKEILRNTPLYLAIAREQRGGSSKELRRPSLGFLVTDLEGLYVPGEVVSLALCFDHLSEPAQLIYSPHNPGSFGFGNEMVRAISGLTLVTVANSGLIEDGDEPSEEFTIGDRVLHVRHGLGVVTGSLPHGRLSVTFDDGQSHTYKPASVKKKITRAPADAPPQTTSAPPAQRLSRMFSRDESEVRQASPAPSPPPSPPLSGRSDQQQSRCSSRFQSFGLANKSSTAKKRRLSRWLGTDAAKGRSDSAGRPQRLSRSATNRVLGVERLLLYLNKDTWKGNDGLHLARLVRIAWSKGVELLLVHENDLARGGCDFAHFFTTTPQVPLALLPDSIPTGTASVVDDQVCLRRS